MPHYMPPSDPPSPDLFSPSPRSLYSPTPVASAWLPLSSSRLGLSVLETLEELDESAEAEQEQEQEEEQEQVVERKRPKLNPRAALYSPVTGAELDTPPTSPRSFSRARGLPAPQYDAPATPPQEQMLESMRREGGGAGAREWKPVSASLGVGSLGGLSSRIDAGEGQRFLSYPGAGPRPRHTFTIAPGRGASALPPSPSPARHSFTPLSASTTISQSLGALGGGGGAQGDKLTRYLLVSGLPPRSTEAELRSLLIDHLPSAVACATHLLPSSGVVLLRFADAREALKAVSVVQRLRYGVEMLSRGEVESMDPANPTPQSFLSPSEGYLTLSLLTPPSSTTVFTSTPTLAQLFPSLLPILSSFGALKNVRQWQKEERILIVEYWDEGDAGRAVKALDGRWVGVEGGEGGRVRLGVEVEPSIASTAFPAALTSSAVDFSSAHSRLQQQQFSSPPPSASGYSHSHSQYSSPLAQQQQQQQPFTPSSSSKGPELGLGLGAGVDRLPLPLARSSNSYTSSAYSPMALEVDQPTRGGYSSLSSTLRSPSRHLRSPDGQENLPTSSSSRSFGAIGSPSIRSPLSPRAQPLPSALGPQYGIYRDDKIPAGNVVHLDRIEAGLDVRTTLMTKNLPNRMTDEELMAFIEEVAGRCFDVVYVRQDWKTGLNVGYGFVNFLDSASLLKFCKARIGTRWNLCGSDKLVVCSMANIQGKSSLVSHFRNSSVLDQDPSRQPKLFYSEGPLKGQPESFPACDDPLRKARSRENAQSLGLFPSQRPVFRVAQALRSLNI